MKVVQFLVFGTIAALFVACGAWAVLWFSGIPISRPSISTQSDFKPIPDLPPSKQTIFTGENGKPLQAPNRIPSLAEKDNDRKQQDSEKELKKKINSICRGC